LKTIQPTKNEHHWPRHEVKSVECRKQDLVLRITNWMKDKDEPGYDVEVCIGGVYDWNESESFTIYSLKTEAKAKAAAIEFAQQQIAKLL
jgi:hypothetical protein